MAPRWASRFDEGAGRGAAHASCDDSPIGRGRRRQSGFVDRVHGCGCAPDGEARSHRVGIMMAAAAFVYWWLYRWCLRTRARARSLAREGIFGAAQLPVLSARAGRRSPRRVTGFAFFGDEANQDLAARRRGGRQEQHGPHLRSSMSAARARAARHAARIGRTSPRAMPCDDALRRLARPID